MAARPGRRSPSRCAATYESQLRNDSDRFTRMEQSVRTGWRHQLRLAVSHRIRGTAGLAHRERSDAFAQRLTDLVRRPMRHTSATCRRGTSA
jgi:hypothetical protein